MFNTIQLQAYALQPNLQIEVYRYEYPKQWIESFRAVHSTLGREKRVLPFRKIKDFLFSWDSGIVYINDFTKANSKDATWIFATAPIDQERLYAVFLDCLRITVEHIRNVYAKEAFLDWVDNLAWEDIVPPTPVTITLTTDTQQIADGRAYEIIPRWIYQQMASHSLQLEDEGKKIPFMVTDNGLLSKPTALAYEAKKKRNYYSLKISATIQTTPHDRTPMLQFKFSITRWVARRVPIDSWNESNTAVYAQVDGRLVKLEIEKKNKKIYWEPIQKEMFQNIYLGQSLPAVETLVQQPESFETFHVVYRLEFGNPMPVGAGESMRDRYVLNAWLSKNLTNLIQPLPPLEKAKSVVGQVNKKMIGDNLMAPEIVREVIATAIGRRKLHVEVYYMGEDEALIEPIQRTFLESLGIAEGQLDSEQLSVSISFIQKNELLAQVDAMKTEIERNEERIQQIQQDLTRATEVTACLVLLPYVREDGRLYFKSKEDPKKAIRAGFATTGRLTQFIDSTNPGSVEHRVKIAVYDLYRQLGYVDPSESKKYKTVSYHTTISAMHIVNSKKTPYGHTKPAMVWLVRNENLGPVMVECPALWEGQKRYWEAGLAFQQIATLEGSRQFGMDRCTRDIKDKIQELHQQKESPHLLLICSDGVSRKKWHFLTDVNLSSVEKAGPYTLQKIWFDKKREEEGFPLSEDNQLRIMRVRINDEVPDYLTPMNEKGNFQTKIGIFRFNEVFYSLARKPLNIDYGNAVLYEHSKLLEKKANRAFKFSNLVELYPIHLQPEDNPEEWVSLTHNYRNLASQFKDTLRVPLLLHMARQLEEYI